jgi:TnpA family transposase
MPTRYLSAEQRLSFGRLPLHLTQDELVKWFTLEESTLLAIRSLRKPSTRLGYAALLTSVRFVGTFPDTQEVIPDDVVTFLRSQLELSAGTGFDDYFLSRTFERHVQSIREEYGLSYFVDVPHIRLGLLRWLYAECWAGSERPGALVMQAADWLISRNVILPGVSTLERLVGRVRDRAQLRLWHCLVNGLSEKQRAKISALFEQDDTALNNLEALRSSPLKRRQSDFLRHLDRLDAVRGYDLRPMPPRGIPAVQLERLARIARRSRPSAIAALKEPRRTATIAALFYTLEASAQDDAAELGEALISDLLREAEQAQANSRAAHQRSLDGAVLLLRDLAGMVTAEDNMPFEPWRESVYKQLPKSSIMDAMVTVDGFVQPAASTKPYKELNARWRRARKLFFNIATRIDLAPSPGGREVAKAMDWLRTQRDWSKASVRSAPKGVISKAWQPYVLSPEGHVMDPKAYVFATIDAWHQAVKRRDVFAQPGIRYADPRAGMLSSREWTNSKGIICRALGRSLDGESEVQHLKDLLDKTYTRVAARSGQNAHLQFETEGGKKKIAISKLDRLNETDSLSELRRNMHRLMPGGGIPDILLEVMSRTGFAKVFTHLSERPAQVDGFETSLCAVLIAQACNVGFEPLAREDHPALKPGRLSWFAQNFIRPETLARANAMIVSAHSRLPITAHWGDGQTASADGLRFLAPKSAIHAGPNPRYFGKGRGITWYNMLSDQYSGLGATVVPGTLRDSLHILALLLEQETELDPSQIMTDNAAYSDTIFGLFWLLGYQFCPRLADIGGAKLWRTDKTADYGPFNGIAEGMINTKLITDNWEDLIRLAGSLKLGHLKAAGVMRILQVRDKPTTLAKALLNLGRLIKSLHVLNYIDDKDFRRRILVQLNRQESRHKMARKIYHGERGEMRNALRQGQEEQLGALGLALNAVTHWNAVYMQEAINQLISQGHIIDPKDITRLSPILWRHINFLGRYEIALPESVAQGGLRPLKNTNSEWEF